MKPRTHVYVTSVGMAAGIGDNAQACCAAVRARISRFEELPVTDKWMRPIVGAPAPEVAGSEDGFARTVPLLAAALRDCFLKVDQAERSRPVVLLAVDQPLGSDPPDRRHDVWLDKVQQILEVRFHSDSRVFTDGAMSFFTALDYARQAIGRGTFKACLVAAVDSLINEPMLRFLDSQERLKSEDNSDGVIPGEAAAAIWLDSQHQSRCLEVTGIGWAQEPVDGTRKLGRGLARAMTGALDEAGLPLERIDFRVGNVTGERLQFMEASVGLARIERVKKESFPLWLPAETLGDVGVALPACMLVLIFAGFLKGYAPGPNALLYATSTTMQRAALVAQATSGASGE